MQPSIPILSFLSSLFITSSQALPRGGGSSKVLSKIVSPSSLASSILNHNIVPTAAAAAVAAGTQRCDVIIPLTIIDIRSRALYDEGHIPGSISMSFAASSVWSSITNDNDSNSSDDDDDDVEIMINFPSKETLFPALEAVGVTVATNVVVVGANDLHTMAMTTRVALTLVYAGIDDGLVGVLDGGFQGWVEDGFEVEVTEEGEEEEEEEEEENVTVFGGVIDDGFVVDMEFVVDHLDMSETVMLLDARPEEAYNGSVQEPGTAQIGHIPGAVSVPAALLFTEEGRFLENKELMRLIRDKVKNYFDGGKGTVIVYCRTGVLASTWTWVLTNVANGWDAGEKVFLYDGSAQEWSLYQDMEV